MKRRNFVEARSVRRHHADMPTANCPRRTGCAPPRKSSRKAKVTDGGWVTAVSTLTTIPVSITPRIAIKMTPEPSNYAKPVAEAGDRHTLPHELPFTYRHNVIDGIVHPAMVSKEQVDFVSNLFPFQDDDIMLATYPKSGTTWTQSIVKHLLNFDEDVKVVDAVPWLERLPSPDCDEVKAAMELTCQPRCFKTHTPWKSIAKSRDGAKLRYIFVARNAKDVCVSLYHHARAFQSFAYEGDFDHFFQMYLHGEVESGSWLDFNLDFYEQHLQNPEDVLFLTYEDMHRNPVDNVMRIAKFINVQCTKERAEDIAQKTTFHKLKNDTSCNYCWANHRRNEGETAFMRKGEVGDFKNYMSEEQEQLIEEQLIRPAAKRGFVIKESTHD